MLRGRGGGALALALGATGIGFAPIFVRLSEVGPAATGFYRIALAQPVVWWILSRQSSKAESKPAQKADLWFAALAGFCFAVDLAVWHWSIRLTTIANSTLLTNLSPFFVTLGAWIFFRERVTARLLTGMVVAFAGGFLLVAESFNLDRHFLIGDFLAVTTAVFYSSYLLAVKRLRAGRSVWWVMAWTGVFTAPILWIVGYLSNEVMLPVTLKGWAVLLGLALISHTCGQGLIAYGLAHISAALSSVLLMWQPVVAALLAWWLLHEPLTMWRALGGLIITAGIVAGTWKSKPASAEEKREPGSPVRTNC